MPSSSSSSSATTSEEKTIASCTSSSSNQPAPPDANFAFNDLKNAPHFEGLKLPNLDGLDALEVPTLLHDVPLVFVHGMKGCTLLHKDTQQWAWLKGNMALSSSFSPLSLELPLDVVDGVQVCMFIF